MPRSMYAGTAAVVACTALLTALKLGGRLDRSKAGQRLWAAWQQTLGLVGLAVVPQARRPQFYVPLAVRISRLRCRRSPCQPAGQARSE